MLLVGHVSGLVRNLNIWIFSDTINVINIKLCMIVLHIKLYLFMTLSMTLTLFQGHSNVKQFLLKILSFFLIKLNLCRFVKYIMQVMKIPLFLTFAHAQGR